MTRVVFFSVSCGRAAVGQQKINRVHSAAHFLGAWIENFFVFFFATGGIFATVFKNNSKSWNSAPCSAFMSSATRLFGEVLVMLVTQLILS
jgi:hypothetical protein